MLGELRSWQEFLEPDTIDWVLMPRRELKARVEQARTSLNKEIERFCAQNFVGMDEPKLVALYGDVKANRGIEIPLLEFETRWARVRPSVYRGHPRHLTLVISLWGLQVRFPEDMLCKDIAGHLKELRDAEARLAQWESQAHDAARRERDLVGQEIQRKERSVRACILACFNLVESYLNGVAWEYLSVPGGAQCAPQDTKLLNDVGRVSLRQKLINYPRIVSGRPLFHEDDRDVSEFLGTIKPFRDAIVHPSPFSAPEKFGGYDKLRLLYNAGRREAELAASLTVVIVGRIHHHISGTDGPRWLEPLVGALHNADSG